MSRRSSNRGLMHSVVCSAVQAIKQLHPQHRSDAALEFAKPLLRPPDITFMERHADQQRGRVARRHG